MQPRLCAAWPLPLVLCLLVLMYPLPTQAAAELTLSLIEPDEPIKVGEPFSLRLRLENHGNEAFLVELWESHSPDGLLITASGTGQEPIEAARWFFDTEVDADDRFNLVPLGTGAAFETWLPFFNDLAGFDTLNLRDPGVYQIQVRLRSRGSQKGSVWRGTATSEPLAITLLPASEERIGTYRSRVRACLALPVCLETEQVEYFRLVRDPAIAEDLRRLLLRDYDTNPRIAEAVANQGSEADADAIESAAALTDSKDIRSYFLQLAKRVRKALRAKGRLGK